MPTQAEGWSPYPMLYAALMSSADRSGFRIGEAAAEFVVLQAMQNIDRRAANDDERQVIAREAIDLLPQLERSIRRYTTETEFPDRESIQRLMRSCDGPYPWCSKV